MANRGRHTPPEEREPTDPKYSEDPAEIQIARALGSIGETLRSQAIEVRAGLVMQTQQRESQAAMMASRAALYDTIRAFIGTKAFNIAMVLLAGSIALALGAWSGLDVEELSRSAAHAYTGCPVGTGIPRSVPNPAPLTTPLPAPLPPMPEEIAPL